MPPDGPPDRVAAAKAKKRAATAAARKNLLKKSKTRSNIHKLEEAVREAAAANVDGDASAAAGGGSGLGSHADPIVLGDEVEVDHGLLEGMVAVKAFRGVAAPVGHENVQPGQIPVDVEVIAAAALKATAAVSQNANGNVLGNRVNGAVKYQGGGNVDDVVEKAELIHLDKELGLAKLWPVKVLKELTPKSTHATRVIYANAQKHKSPFDKSLNCRYTTDELWATMKPFKAVQSKYKPPYHKTDSTNNSQEMTSSSTSVTLSPSAQTAPTQRDAR